MPDPNGPNGPVAYSMVLVGKITGKRLNDWLEAHATSRETYAGHTIYNIPSEGRQSASRRSAMTWWPSPTPPPPSRFTPSSTAIAPPRCPSPAPRCSRSTFTRCLCSPSPGASAKSASPSLRAAPSRPRLRAAAQAGLHHHRQHRPCAARARLAAASALKRLPPANPSRQPGCRPRHARHARPRLLSPLGTTPPTSACKELLKTAEVTQHGERVVITATLPASSRRSMSQVGIRSAPERSPIGVGRSASKVNVGYQAASF